MRAMCLMAVLVSGPVALAVEPAKPADGPGLVDEKVVLAPPKDAGGDGWKLQLRGPCDIQVGPLGARLLYIRRQKGKMKRRGGEGFEDRTIRRLVLRDVARNVDTVLPIPAIAQDEVLKYMLTCRLFDSVGKKIALGVGVDDDKDGVTSPGDSDRMRGAIFDIATGELKMLDVEGQAVVPSFDRTGKKLYLLKWDVKKWAGTLHVADATKLEFDPLKFLGLPRGFCPAADVAAMLIKAPQKGSLGYKLALYDQKADKQMLELPTAGYGVEMVRFCPKWTADGRYLYYRNLAKKQVEGRARFYPVTRLWDRKTARQIAEIPDAHPVGPGPAAGAMVLAIVQGGNVKQTVVHTAATGKFVPVDGLKGRPVAVAGGRVFYVKWTDSGDTLFSAKIAMPAEKK